MKLYAYIALASIASLYAKPNELHNTKYLLMLISPDPEDGNPENSRLYQLSKYGPISIYCLKDTVPLLAEWNPKYPIFLTKTYSLFNKAQARCTRLEQNDTVKIPTGSYFVWGDNGETLVGVFPSGATNTWNAHTGKLQTVD